MLELSEIRAMQSALDAYVARMQRTVDVRDSLPWTTLPAERERVDTIISEQRANLERFKARRNELINMEPSDHDAVLQFVETVRKIANDPLPTLLRQEAESDSVAGRIGNTAIGIGQDLRTGVKEIITAVLIAAAVFLILTRRG